MIGRTGRSALRPDRGRGAYCSSCAAAIMAKAPSTLPTAADVKSPVDRNSPGHRASPLNSASQGDQVEFLRETLSTNLSAHPTLSPAS